MGDLELLDELEGTQPLAQVSLVGGRHDGRHACQAMNGARSAQPLVEVALRMNERSSASGFDVLMFVSICRQCYSVIEPLVQAPVYITQNR